MNQGRTTSRRAHASTGDVGRRNELTARQQWPRERRSATRPAFVDGWRKSLVPDSFAAGPKAGSTNKIEIWLAGTNDLLRANSCIRLLNNKDWESLGPIKHPASRNSAIAARVLLRLGLSKAVDRHIGPADWEFSVGERSKPIVATGFPHVHFSVSHVEQLAMVAISSNLKVGVDVESVDQSVAKDVISGFCHPDEQHSMATLPDPQRTREFIRFWTLKEAYSKMRGLGHSLDFEMIKFTFDPIKLAATGERAIDSSVLFENFFVTRNHTLFNASLAVEELDEMGGSTEIQLISLVDSPTLRGR
jgi:4'-phosphopantetheinyl transferase